MDETTTATATNTTTVSSGILPPFPYDPVTYDPNTGPHTISPILNTTMPTVVDGSSASGSTGTASGGSGTVDPADPVYCYAIKPLEPGVIPSAIGMVPVPIADPIRETAVTGIQPISAAVPSLGMTPVLTSGASTPVTPPAQTTSLPTGTTVATPNATAPYVPSDATAKRLIEGWILVLSVLIVAVVAALTVWIINDKPKS